MCKKCKNILILLLSFVAAIIMCFSLGLSNSTTAVAQQTAVFEMVYGAGIRVSDPTGMRFKTRFSQDYYEELSTTDASLFVAIFPYADYSAYNASGKQMPDWLEEKYGAGKYINIEINESTFYKVAEDDCYYANAVISNLYFNNYHRQFVGVAYIRRGAVGAYTYEYTTTSITKEDNARSIYEVACKANMDEEDSVKYGESLEVMIKNGLYGAYGVTYDKNTKTYSLDGNTYTSIEVLENEVKLAQATLSVENDSLTVGSSKQLVPVFTYEDGTVLDKDAIFTWDSSNPEVATIDEDGLVSAIAAGDTTITVTACGGLYTATCTISVSKVEPVGTIIQDCVFDITDFNTGTSFVASTEITTPNGFEKLYKYENAGQEALHGGNWSGVNLDNYSIVTFAIKTAKFNFNNESNDTSNEWLVFTLTQTDTAVWTLVVTKNGEVVYEKAGLSGNRETGGAYVYNALDAILYGVPSQGYTAWGVDGNLLIYATELRGVEKPVEPVGTIIDNCAYVSYGFQETNEISIPAGFEKVSKYQGTDSFIHGAHFSDANLDNYSIVTFALKTANFNMNSMGANTSNEWLVFTLTQTAPDTWDLVVTQNGETVHENSGLRGAYDSSANPNYHDNALDAILYGNPSGYSPTGIDGSMLIYVTELRGVSTVVEPDPEEPVELVGTLIDNCVYVDYGFQETTEIAGVPGFEKVHKYEGTDGYIHGAFFSDVNLDNYSVVTFALKTASFNMNSMGANESNEWLVFTLTQTAPDTWDLVVTQNGETVHENSGLRGAYDSSANPNYHDNALDAILYGNPSGYSPTGVDGSMLIYVTEVRGVEFLKENILIADKLYESGYDFVKTDEISGVEGFKSVYKYAGTDEALHGAYMASANLDEYLQVRFAVKATKYNFNNVSTDTSNEWLLFTLTQTDTAVWSLIVTKNGEVVHFANGLSGNRNDGSYSYNALDAILYGVPSQGYAPWGVDGSIIVYTTEVLGDLATGEVTIIDTDKTFFVKSETANGATVSLSELGLGIPTVTSVLIDGEEFTDFSVSNDAVILADAPRGNHEYTFIYGEDGYRVDGCVYDNGLSTADDVNSWRNGLSGYSVLLNNINYEGATIGAGGYVTDQTLDGRGYKISNFIMTANFVTRLYNNNAVVKNVYFDDVTQDCSAWSGAVDQGLFGNWHSGKIENVYVNIKTINMSGEHYGVLFYGTEPNAVVRNVVVEIESDCDKAHYVHMEDAATGTVVENLVGSGLNVGEGGKAGWSGAASGFHQYLNWMVIEEANDELLNFTSPYWVIDTAANTITMLPLAETKPVVVEDGYLVKDGASAYTIVLSSNASSLEKEAAMELRALFAEATGVTFRTVIDSNVTYSDSAKYISIGYTSLLSDAGIHPDTTVGAQGYEIKTKGQSLFVIGQPQGTIYGVYKLLNLTLNFEQYTKTVYTLNHVSDLALLDVDIVDVPDVEHRVAFSGVQLNDETSRQRMRTQHTSEVMMNKGNAHNMIRYIVPFDTYYSTNPTWFSSQTDSSDTYETTQLCYTAGSYGSSSYNAMKAVAVENIKQIILENPNADMMSLTQMDVQNMWCNCSGCQAVISQYGEESATQILFINDVVSEIETWLNNEQGGREVKFMMFAYYETQEAPTKGSLKLHEDVSVWIAPIKDNFMTGVNASGNSLGTMLTDWKDNASSVAIWAYGVYFSEYLVPYNTFDYIDQMIDACVASNAEYMWVQGNWNTTQNTGFDSLKAYLISKLMWDSTLDVDTLTDNYFNAVYGAAATTMKTVYTEMKAELASMSLSGNIYDAPCGFDDWDNNYLKTQLGRLETAISEIASLQSSDPAKYQLIYDAIVCESISFRYIYKENSLFGWGGNYNTDAWGTFEEDVTRLGFTMIREGETMDSYL